jgi:ribonuclease D
LAALLEEHFQVTLDKDMQTADWRQRPLTTQQEEYARTDTRFLIALRDILLGQLREQDKLDQAASEFERILDRVHVPRQFDPGGWTRIRGVKELNGLGRAILSELYAWRDEEARRRDMAAFRVVSDRQLCELARRAPTDPADVPDTYHDELWAAVQRGHERGFTGFPEPAKNKLVDNRLSRAEQETYDRLRKWRNETATEAGVEADQVVPNRLLKLVARSLPANRKELGEVPGFESWRVDQHGNALLEALIAPPED